MKTIIAILLLLTINLSSYGQKEHELLVYSLKGNVSVVENNAEQPLKIGKVLKPGAYIKTKRLSKLTMVCKQGKPISVTKEGTFPVTRWKDSCETKDNSVTTKYFQFIWDQLYVRSDEYKKQHPGSETLLTDAPVRGQEELEIILSPQLDTVYYANGSFPIAWSTTKPYSGHYFVTLINDKTKKKLYADSLQGTHVSLDRLKKFMRPGNIYKWSLSLKKDTEGETGYIKHLTSSQVNRQVNKLKKLVNIPEDAAAQFFRMAYLLEESRYLPAAYEYYRKAASLAPGVSLFKEKLDEFKKNFGLQ